MTIVTQPLCLAGSREFFSLLSTFYSLLSTLYFSLRAGNVHSGGDGLKRAIYDQYQGSKFMLTLFISFEIISILNSKSLKFMCVGFSSANTDSAL